jgi:DNA-binding transcriptional MocR family regulator
MPMTPQLFSIEGLAIELGFDRRTVGRALRDVPADGTIKGRPGWRLKTAIRVLNRRDGKSGTGSEAAADEIEQVAEQLEAGLSEAERLEDVTERRALLKRIGPLCGRLDRLMKAQDGDDITLQVLHEAAMRDAVLRFNHLWGPVQTPSANSRGSRI